MTFKTFNQSDQTQTDLTNVYFPKVYFMKVCFRKVSRPNFPLESSKLFATELSPATASSELVYLLINIKVSLLDRRNPLFQPAAGRYVEGLLGRTKALRFPPPRQGHSLHALSWSNRPRPIRVLSTGTCPGTGQILPSSWPSQGWV